MATRPATTPEAAPREVGWPSRKRLDGEPAEHGGGRGGQGVDPDQAGLLHGGGGTGVEAEPAEPQDGGAEHDERDVVRAVVRVLAEALAVADDQDQDQAGDAGVDVDHGAAGEVDDRARTSGRTQPLGGRRGRRPRP